MRRLILLTAFLSICNLSLAREIKFKDMADRHWAGPAVFDLVKRGVTSGFPDGTFRGFRIMNRQEMSAFISKLAETSTNMAAVEKLVAELKSELSVAKFGIENPDTVKLGGSIEQRFRAGNIILNNESPHGLRIDYRLKLTAARQFNANRYLTINLDTVDAGFNGGTRDLAAKLFDIEGKTRLGIYDLKVNFGPGTISHIESDGTIPSEDHYIYIRPKPSLSVSTAFGPMELAASFVSRKVTPWGEVGLSEFTGTASYTYQKLPVMGKTRISLTPRHLWSNGSNDTRGEINIQSMPAPSLSYELLFGVGRSGSNRGLYVKSAIGYASPDTEISFTAHKVGSEYREAMDKYEFVALNNFNKLILDGSVDIGLKISQRIFNNLKARFTNDTVLTSSFKYGEEYPGTSTTNELLFGNEIINIFYRNYFAPSGISSTDPSMARSIARSSDLLGLVLNIQF